ncbi:unnamed protein product, partial [Allacma fusca]
MTYQNKREGFGYDRGKGNPQKSCCWCFCWCRWCSGRGSKENPNMGNQGIRQHVEMSSKTGVFHMSKAKLHEFPPDLAKIVDVLRSIDMSENKIAEIPINVGAFVNLKHLCLNRNHIEAIPDQIGSLSKLESLSLAGNRIRTIPVAIQKLKKLKDVNLSENQISNFPLVFCGLTNMVVLNLASNKIQEIPDGVGALQVIELILNQNQ